METEPRMIPMLVASYRALPRWKKAITITSSIFLAPFILLVGTITLLSSIPVWILGEWEGEMGRKPMRSEAGRLLRHRRKLTQRYYAT